MISHELDLDGWREECQSCLHYHQSKEEDVLKFYPVLDEGTLPCQIQIL